MKNIREYKKYLKNFGGDISVKLAIGRTRSRREDNIQTGLTKIDF
jgi:hypothetical protein